jgi:predicted ABC-type ATPase
MDYSKPTLLVISGPNGAGKSTHIQTMLPADFEGIWSFDRDNTRTEFAKTLESQSVKPDEIFHRATVMMENRLVQEMKKPFG